MNKWLKESLDSFKQENKEDHNRIITHLAKLNGTVDKNQNKIIKLEQKQRDHFFFHQQYLNTKRHIEKMNRAQLALIFTAVQVAVAIITIYLIR